MITQAIKDACQKVRGGRYFVHRGMINWPKFDFKNYPHAISLTIPMVDEDSPENVTIEATATLEMMTRMPDFSRVREVNDEVLDQMRDDHRFIADELQMTRLPGSRDPMFFNVTRLPTIEIGDSNYELQGIQRSLVLEF